jgi:hypothetical protein
MSNWGFLRSGRGRRRGAAVVAIVCVLVIGAVALLTGAGAAASSRLAQVQRGALAPAGGTALGAPTASATQSGYVVLKPRDPAALSSFLSQIDDRSSASYHHYLPAGQFASRFGPTAATISAVKAQLSSDGLTVAGTTDNGMMIKFTGTTSRVDSAFSTTLERYRTQTGITGQEATSAIKLPASISPDVSAVLGLNTLLHPEADLIHPPKSAYAGRAAAKTASIASYPAGAPDPCSDASAAASEYGGLTDDQIANAYGAFGLYGASDDGTGVHIGVYELEPFDQTDLTTFNTCYFGSSQAATMANNLTIKTVDGGAGTGPGSGEAILDVEDVSAMAPGADIDVYEAPNSVAGGLDEYAQMVNDDVDKIITSSWGFCESDEAQYEPGSQQAEDYLFEQAAAQGQTVLSAAGDTGDDTCNEIRSTPPPTDQNPLSVNDPSSQPYVMAVGGTTIQDADPSDYAETVWNDGSEWGGGGGGISSTWAAPSWQLTAPNFETPTSTHHADYTNADTVEADAATDGISEADEPWETAPYFCGANSTAGFSATTACRALPDVSAQADEFTGAVTVYVASQGGWLTYGGTSSATPIWAGLLALVDDSAACASAGITPATGIGFAVPLLYAIADNAGEYANSFHDITSGNNDIFGFDGGAVFPARAGYDMASGLGSPKLTNASGTPGLAANLCTLAGTASAAPSISSLSPTVGSVAGGNTLTITGTGFKPTDGATLADVTIGSDVIPASAVTVVSNTELTLKLPAGSTSLAPNGGSQTDPGTGITYPIQGSTGTQDGAGPADVTVTLSNGQSTKLGPNSQYSYVDEASGGAIPSVSSVQPYAGLESAPAQVTIYGSGFAAGDTVTIGGEPATNVTVISAHELTATPPKLVSGTNNNLATGTAATTGDGTYCATAGAITTETALLDDPNYPNGDTDPAADDICQTQVVVTNSFGSSKTDTTLPTAYEGPISATQDTLTEVPTGFEITPQPTEYDYYPTPTITSVSTQTATPASLADADPPTGTPGTTITITGTGLDLQTLEYLLVGDPTLASSEAFGFVYDTGNTMIVTLPGDPNLTAANPTPGPEPDAVPVAVETVAATSAPGPTVIYAGIPVISAVSTQTTDPITGYPVAPDTGGTALIVTGQGFSDLSGPLEFSDALGPFSFATQYTYTAKSDTVLDTTTPGTNPAVLDTLACTVSGCSAASSAASTPSTADEILEYPPGDPVLSGLSVTSSSSDTDTTTSGPADGGSIVTLTGENLGCATTVSFGGVPALSVANNLALLDCGSTNSVTVIAPPGTAGTTVPITLTTVESDVQDPAVTATSPTAFTYTANPTITPLSYGSVDVGANLTETVTVTNPGSGNLTLGGPTGDGNPTGATIIGDDPSEFTITDDQCSSTVLGPGDSCTIQVQFTPTASGSQDAVLDLPFNDSPTDLTATLSGNGTLPTTTVTEPAATVTTPATTVTTPAKVYLVYYAVVCEATPQYKYENVKVKVKVKVHGKTKTETKVERKKVKYKTTQVCHTKTLTATQLAIARAPGHFRTEAAAARVAAARTTASAARPDKKKKLKKKHKK